MTSIAMTREEIEVYRPPSPRQISRLSTEPDRRESPPKLQATGSPADDISGCESKYHGMFSPTLYRSLRCRFCNVCHPLEILFNGNTDKCEWDHEPTVKKIKKDLHLSPYQIEQALERYDAYKAGKPLAPTLMRGEAYAGEWPSLWRNSVEPTSQSVGKRRRSSSATARTSTKRPKKTQPSSSSAQHTTGSYIAVAVDPDNAKNGETFWIGKVVKRRRDGSLMMAWRQEIVDDDGRLTGVFRYSRDTGVLSAAVAKDGVVLDDVKLYAKVIMLPEDYAKAKERALALINEPSESDGSPELFQAP